MLLSLVTVLTLSVGVFFVFFTYFSWAAYEPTGNIYLPKRQDYFLPAFSNAVFFLLHMFTIETETLSAFFYWNCFGNVVASSVLPVTPPKDERSGFFAKVLGQIWKTYFGGILVTALVVLFTGWFVGQGFWGKPTVVMMLAFVWVMSLFRYSLAFMEYEKHGAFVTAKGQRQSLRRFAMTILIANVLIVLLLFSSPAKHFPEIELMKNLSAFVKGFFEYSF